MNIDKKKVEEGLLAALDEEKKVLPSDKKIKAQVKKLIEDEKKLKKLLRE